MDSRSNYAAVPYYVIADMPGGAMFWMLMLLFFATCVIALAGQRLLERHSSRGVKKWILNEREIKLAICQRCIYPTMSYFTKQNLSDAWRLGYWSSRSRFARWSFKRVSKKCGPRASAISMVERTVLPLR